MASFARSLADGAAAADGLASPAQRSRPLADGAAAGDQVLPWDIAGATWILGPLIDPWTIGPILTLTT